MSTVEVIFGHMDLQSMNYMFTSANGVGRMLCIHSCLLLEKNLQFSQYIPFPVGVSVCLSVSQLSTSAILNQSSPTLVHRLIVVVAKHQLIWPRSIDAS